MTLTINQRAIANRNLLALWGLWGFLVNNPDKHDQNLWMAATPGEEDAPDHVDPNFECGTIACAAGWACLLSGDRPSFDEYNHIRYRMTVFNVFDKEDKAHSIQMRASAILGISRPVSTALFSGSNERDHLLAALKMLAQGRTDREVITYLGNYNDTFYAEELCIQAERIQEY